MATNYLDIFKNGMWQDYNGEDTDVRYDETVTNADGSKSTVRKTNYKAAFLNGLGNFSAYGAAIMSNIPSKETADNEVNGVATSVRNTAQNVLMSSGNPIMMGIGAASMLSDRVGGSASATEGLGTFNDILNFGASQVPFLGFLGKKMGKKFETDLLKGSSMYNWSDRADGLFNGRIVVGGGRAKSMTKDRNYKLSLADNILTDGKLSLIPDQHYALLAYNDVKKGGWNYVSGKNGMVLQFSKRTLSKRKYLTGGPIYNERTLEELVDYVKLQNPLFWKRMSGEDKNYIVNDDGSVSSLRMTYSQGENLPYVDVYPQVLYDLNGNLRYYEHPIEAYRMAKLHNDVVRMSKAEAELFTSLYKKSKLLKDYYDNYTPPTIDPEIEYNAVTINGAIPLNIPPEWLKDGGKVNVIPEGALHKNKHNLDKIDEKFKEVTTKGIPVVVESEGGDLVLQAEVEKEEIIFRLEVTKKLEELSKKGTDEAAIEAGKLLVKEILHNTIDRTNSMI